jgi:acyl carrier protein
MTDIAQRVRQVVGFILKTHEDAVVDKARFVEDLHATSLDFVELIMAIEDEFAVEISDTDAESISTVGDITTLVAGKARLPAAARSPAPPPA